MRTLCTFNQVLVGKSLWHYGYVGNHLCKRIIGRKYGNAWGQLTTELVRSTYRGVTSGEVLGRVEIGL